MKIPSNAVPGTPVSFHIFDRELHSEVAIDWNEEQAMNRAQDFKVPTTVVKKQLFTQYPGYSITS